MILTDKKIKELMEKGQIEIENFIPENLGPVSYDLTIHEEVRHIKRLNGSTINITDPKTIGIIRKLPIYLKNGDSLVFSTKERVKVSDSITGIVFARSSLTKLPLLFNIAGLVDPGFHGSITGVIYNLSTNIIEISKMRICQIVFHQHRPVEIEYGKRKSSKNQNQNQTNSLISKQDIEFK